MHLLQAILSLPLLLPQALTSPTSRAAPNTQKDLTPLPLIIWHGLGDTYTNPSLTSLSDVVNRIHEGTYTHLIHLGDDAATDRRNTFLGNVTTQIAEVCAQLAADPILSTAPAVNAIGFSQGGQFLRAYVERCNAPPVRTLITFGSQHNGISQFQACRWGDLVCLGAEALLHAGRWSGVVQGGFVPGQYFRPQAGQRQQSEMELYLQHSNFLADVNNERDVKNETYKENLSSLEKFVMLMFEDDGVVHPKESAWFAEVDADGVVVGLRDRQIYKEDWLGLRKLDEKGALVFRTVPGRHMEIGEEVFERVVREFLGPVELEVGVEAGLGADGSERRPGLVVQGAY
ncbi:palmitoyl-protein thioesterase precursor [Aspergillus japonicus CBS 114.51]|uniref:Palmitoyl-protein thioesterase 1 n=1 Tax=Aspergillus japonicus CBS 114.51 TaxID=1448312 RepID=A0A8T8WXT1_ASPJA|nr:palmitoyl-protein thioesterase precursor [Aspergillus japonicus CBS 114.51]RAH80621.1 palmitoyl-protein thioesterase precursor [Aspergillus japonicus CBS 114.51]